MDRLENLKANYDWQSAFGYSDYSIEDIINIVAEDEGYNDGPEWIGIFEMKDGKTIVLRAECNYTGWDCQACGHDEVFNSVDEAISRNSLKTIDIGRLGQQILSKYTPDWKYNG